MWSSVIGNVVKTVGLGLKVEVELNKVIANALVYLLLRLTNLVYMLTIYFNVTNAVCLWHCDSYFGSVILFD